MKIAVFGLGYVGTITAACLATQGHEVSGVDIDEHKLALIAEGRSPVREPGLEELIASCVAKGRLRATADPSDALSGAEVSLICVGTPSTPTGGTDLTFVQRATEQVAEALSSLRVKPGFHVVAIRSTVPPGTVDGIVAPILASRGHYATAMCPEFLREGSGVRDFLDPPMTIVGTADRKAAAVLTRLFSFLDEPVRVVPVRTAEALKYACNAFHAAKVAFANEMGRVFRPLGLDSRAVMELFCEDRRLNISSTYLRPGFAFGGPCLPKDLRSLLHLARANNVDLPMLSGVLSSNELVLADVIERITSGSGMNVALLGLSFKVASDDLRESPNVRLAEALLGKGYSVRIHDPVIKPSQLIGTNRLYVESRLPHLQRLLADSAAEALEKADTAVVSSSHDDVIKALVEAAPSRILDLSGRLGQAVESLPGYEGVGW